MYELVPMSFVSTQVPEKMECMNWFPSSLFQLKYQNLSTSLLLRRLHWLRSPWVRNLAEAEVLIKICNSGYWKMDSRFLPFFRPHFISFSNNSSSSTTRTNQSTSEKMCDPHSGCWIRLITFETLYP